MASALAEVVARLALSAEPERFHARGGTLEMSLGPRSRPRHVGWGLLEMSLSPRSYPRHVVRGATEGQGFEVHHRLRYSVACAAMRFCAEVGSIDSSRHADDSIYAGWTAFRREFMLYWRSWQLRRGGCLLALSRLKIYLHRPLGYLALRGSENCGWGLERRRPHSVRHPAQRRE
jgi:hypothetical protein